nr:hypothetical protein [Tanacetum cinerariifolium]
KKVLGGAVLKLVTRVKRLEGLLQQRKRRLVLSDSEGEDATPTEQDIDLEALHTLASTSLGGDSSYKAAGHDAAEPFTSFASVHVPENIPAGAGIPAAATTIPAGSSMDAAVHAVVAPSSSIPAVDKGKAPMVDDSLPTDLLSEQERILKNLHDYQLGEDLAKKLHAEQEAEFARQQEELAQKAQAERVASPTEHGPGLEPTPVREPMPRPVQDRTLNSPRPPFHPHYPRSEEVGTTTSTRPPSPTRQTSFQADVSEGGGDFVSSPQSNEAPPTPAATAAGSAEDSAALTALSLKLNRCLNRVTSLENKLGITKKVLGGAVLKLVTRVKRLEGLLQQRNGDFVSSPQSNEAPPTPAATAAGSVEDSAALTALSLKLNRCLNRVTSLENKLGITKKVLGGAVLKLVTRV